MSIQLITHNKKDLERVIDLVIDKLRKTELIYQTDIKPENDRLSQKECAEMLGVSVVTLISYKRKKLIPFFKIGSRVFYSKTAVLNAIRKGNIKVQ